MTAGRLGSAWSGPSGRDRAVSAVVGKSLEAGIVVLYISMLVGVLYGGVVPEYEAAAGEELGERVLAEAALEIQSAVPANPETETTARHEVPSSIDDATYRIEARDDALALVHGDDDVAQELPLALPPDVAGIEGAWVSHETNVVRVERTPDGRVVVLEADST